MDLGILGLAKSGKTSVFNALTGGHAETAAFGRTGLQPTIGVVKVSDPRLEQLALLAQPKRIVPAEVCYLDIGATPTTFTKGEGISGVWLNALSRMDALVHVVRAFTDENIPHPHGSVDPARDIEAVNLELAYADAALIERRLERIELGLKAAKAGEREAATYEREWLGELKRRLEEGTPARELDFSEAQRQALVNYALLTAKPLLILLNIGEDQLAASPELEGEYRSRCQHARTEVLALCGKLEMELAQMEPREAEEFRAAMGVPVSGLQKVTQASYRLLGFISFFTTGPDETRAWTIRRDIHAPQAAGKIHTDMEKGFIRAEVVSWEQLLACGSWAEARKRGHLRTEGKSYLVQDGDVLNILFSR